jgi:hypothetical protein
MMDAKSSGQIGHPAAWMIANNLFPCNGPRARTLSNLPDRGKLRTASTLQPARALPDSCSGFRDIHKNLWISLWIVAELRDTYL